MRIVEVLTGEVHVLHKKGKLRASALGSCIGVTVFDPVSRAGGLAHIMLPGEPPPNKSENKTRYAAFAINELINRSIELGGDFQRMRVCLAGAGNVLQKDKDTICSENIKSVKQELQQHGLAIDAQKLGGVFRRSMILDLEAGIVWYTQSESSQQILFAY